MMTFRRLYLRKPYSGDLSSYCAMLLRISTMPPLPRPNSSTSSRLAYFSKNLFRNHGQHSYLEYWHTVQQGAATLGMLRVTRSHNGDQKQQQWKGRTYHPPGSATAASCAALTLSSSNPFSDISGYRLGHTNPVSFLYPRLHTDRWRCCSVIGRKQHRFRGNRQGWTCLSLSRAYMERLARRKAWKLRG